MTESSYEAFVTIAEVGDIPEGQGRAYPLAGRMVAVFLHGSQYYAIDDACPHMGASLAAGHLEGTAVMCPWHAWQFCVATGTWLDNPKSPLRANSHEIRVAGREIQVRLTTGSTSEA